MIAWIVIDSGAHNASKRSQSELMSVNYVCTLRNGISIPIVATLHNRNHYIVCGGNGGMLLSEVNYEPRNKRK